VQRKQFLSALILLAALGFVSCTGEDGPTGVRADVTPSPLLGSGNGLLGTPLGSGLLACDSLPYASDSLTIGPAGGTLVLGPHTLTVPAGALAEPVLITGEAPAGTVNSVRLFPEGLHFAPGRPARLTLSYANCPLTGRLLPKRIAYTTDLLQILSYVLSLDDLFHQKVSGSLDHFSRYAVAW
jgi:hypothetical protein